MKHYRLNLYVLDNQGNVVEDSVFEKDSSTELTVTKLKELSNNGKYTNILSEDFTSSHIVLKNTDLVRFPFLTYTIKLK